VRWGIAAVLHRILTASARSDYSVDLAWDDGSRSSVSFADLVSRGVCARLSDKSYFVERMTIADDGYALAWPNEVEFSADLWYKTHPEDARRDIEAAE